MSKDKWTAIIIIGAAILLACILAVGSRELREKEASAGEVLAPSEQAPFRPMAAANAPDPFEPVADKGDWLDCAWGRIRINRGEKDTAGGMERFREYVYPDGACFYQQQLCAAASRDRVLMYQISCPAGETALTYYDIGAKEWLSAPLAEGIYGKNTYFICSEQGSFYLVTPLAYGARDNGMLEYLPQLDGWLEVSTQADGWTLSFYAPCQEDTRVDFLCYYSPTPLLDWDDPNAVLSWPGYLFHAENRWCYDGYYYLAPQSYIPSGDNYFFPLPAAYIVDRWVHYSFDEYAAAHMSLAMLDIMLERQNEEGWFPSAYGSAWLLEDYGIGPGFYDTRFNSDLVESLLLADKKYQVESFREAALAYGAFFLEMAETHHHEVPSADGQQAWLVWDYYHPNGQLPTHCSLNHQLAEILVLYLLDDIDDDPAYGQLADKMLRGVTAVGHSWIMYDQNLHYAYLPDGSMGLNDYPYLTYNDLHDVQQALLDRTGEKDPGLTALMEAKLQWMQARHITGHK